MSAFRKLMDLQLRPMKWNSISK